MRCAPPSRMPGLRGIGPLLRSEVLRMWCHAGHGCGLVLFLVQEVDEPLDVVAMSETRYIHTSSLSMIEP